MAEEKKSNRLSFLRKEFILSRRARPLRILSEYLEPEDRLTKNNINHTVVVFGSARLKPESKYYQAAEDMAFKLTKLGDEIEQEVGENVYICTGGGPGIMEAANKGAYRAGKKTIGLNIELPFEQNSNPYITPELNFDFDYFYMRKLWFLLLAKAIIVFPGGFGTMDELFETLTLMQTKKIDKFNLPILLYDKKFWTELINFDKFIELGLISPNDMDLIYFFESPDEGIDFLKPKLKEYMRYLDIYYE